MLDPRLLLTDVEMIVQDEGLGCYRGAVKSGGSEARETELASEIGYLASAEYLLSREHSAPSGERL